MQLKIQSSFQLNVKLTRDKKPAAPKKPSHSYLTNLVILTPLCIRVLNELGTVNPVINAVLNCLVFELIALDIIFVINTVCKVFKHSK